MMVVLFHATRLAGAKLNYSYLGGWWSFGYSGVDFFFVLSGFIITYIHAGDIGRGWSALRLYAAKRVVRVYPIYWAVMFTLVVTYILIPSLGEAYKTRPSVILQSTILPPWHHDMVLDVSWTLNHEVLFYTLFAVAIIAGLRLTRWAFGIWIAVTGLAWMGEMFIYRKTSPLAYPFGVPLASYNLEFAFGCLSAILTRRGLARHGVFLVTTGVAWYLTAGTLDQALLRKFGNAHRIFSYGLPAFLIVLGITSIETRRHLNVPWLAKLIGDASYSLYLVHYPALSLIVKIGIATHVFGWLGPMLGTTVACLLAAAAGCACYLLLEKPLLKWCRRAFVDPLAAQASA